MVRKKNDEIPKSDFEVNESQDLLSFDSEADIGDCVAISNFNFSLDSNLDMTSDNLYI